VGFGVDLAVVVGVDDVAGMSGDQETLFFDFRGAAGCGGFRIDLRFVLGEAGVVSDAGVVGDAGNGVVGG